MKYIVIMTLAIGLVACGSSDKDNNAQKDGMSKEELLAQIAEYEEYAFADKVRMDRTAGQKLLVSYKKYANEYHEDSLAADYLFKAGEIARNLGKYRQAISLFENVHDGYADFHKRPETAFIVAFIYDNDLNDREKAREKYLQVMELYPDHQFARDAEARLQTLHMTDEELIEFFKEKNQAS